MAMSNFDVKVSLEETAKLAWETFGKAWSFDDGGIDKRWLYTVQQWPMPANGNPGKIAKRFWNELWSHMEKTYGVINQEQDLAERVLKLLGDDWRNHITKKLLAKELGKSKKSKGVKSMHGRITSILENLQPTRPTSARQASSWSSSRAVEGSHYEVLGSPPSECVTAKEVQSAFIKLARRWNQDKGHVAESKLRDLVAARDALHASIGRKDESNVVPIWYESGTNLIRIWYQSGTNMIPT